jgi:hypothetical protein
MSEITRAPGFVASPFVQWVYDTYYAHLKTGGLEGSKEFREFIESMDSESFPLSAGARVQAFHIIKFNYPLRTSGYSVGVFSARVISPTSQEISSTIYAYAYWPKESSALTPEYACISPTFRSQDGEYRERFLWGPQLEKNYAANEEILGVLEDQVTRMLAEGKLDVNVDFYGSDEPDILRRGCEDSRLKLRLFIGALIMDARDAVHGRLQNHVNSNYTAFMRTMHGMVLKHLNKIGAAETVKLQNVFRSGKNSSLRARCGQKVAPLTLREAMNIGDLGHGPWREARVARWAGDLVINGIAPMFPIYNNWTIISSDRHMFENEPMYRKFERGDLAEKAAAHLREARKTMAPLVADFRAQQFDAHMYETIVYAQESLVLSDSAICSVDEHVGPTIGSLPAIARKSRSVAPAICRFFESGEMQERYLFDLCYGAHVLHTRVGVVHGDLHVNNMTLFEYAHRFHAEHRGKDVVYSEICPNPVVAYVIGDAGEADTYVFPHDGSFACLIDFSRATLGPSALARAARERGLEGFGRSQAARALRILNHYIPNHVQPRQEKIKGLLLAEPAAMFELIAAVDFIAIGRNIAFLLGQVRDAEPEADDLRRFSVAAEGGALAAEVERHATEFLLEGLATLEHGGRRSRRPPVGETIIRRVFEHRGFAAWAAARADAEATLVDIYRATAPLSYSADEYETFPPWAKFEELEKHLDGSKITSSVTAGRTSRPFLESLGFDSYLSVLQNRAGRRAAQDPPGAETSSWIAD